MKNILILLVLILIGTAAYIASNVIPISGALDKYETKLVGQCDRLDISPGTEDIAIDHNLGVAFVSAADRRAWFLNGGSEGASVPNGGIFVVDLSDPTSSIKVSPDNLDDFQPHGISLWHGENGARRLFVINHPSTGAEIVEIFDVGPDNILTHVESISFKQMYSPNDVVAVGPRQFYATNDRRYDAGVMASIETYFALPMTSVVYFDGNKGEVAATGLVYANGINVSSDGAKVFVAEVLKRRMTVFDRNEATGDLARNKRIKLNTAPDNIDVDEHGMLWIGGHPQALKFAGHAEDAANISPSHVVRVDPETGDVEDVFVSLDGEINGSSVGAAFDGQLLVGAVFEPHIMVCPLP